MNEFAPPPDRKVTYKALNSEAVAAARAAAGAAGLTTEDWLSRVILENAQANGIITSDPGFGVSVGAGLAGSDTPDAGVEQGPAFHSSGDGPSAMSMHQPFSAHTVSHDDHARAIAGPDEGYERATAHPTTAKLTGAAGLAQQLQQAKQAADQAGVPIAAWLNRAIIDSARAQVSRPAPAEIIREAPDKAATAEPAVDAQAAERHDAETAYPDVRKDAARDDHAETASPDHGPNGDATNGDAVHVDGRAVSPSGQQGIPDGIPHRPGGDMALPAAASDPLQERLARIVAARREEQAQFDHPDDPPMILASRPKEAGKHRAATKTAAASRGLVDFDEIDRRSHAGNLSWFWVTMMIILTAIACIIWALPFLGTDVSGAGRNATTAAIPPVKSTGVRIPVQKPKVAGTALPKPAHQHVEQWRKAAAEGNPVAQIGLAKLMLSGKGVTRDPAAAAKLLREAADRNNAPEAQFLLGFLLERGLGVTKSFVDATLYYQKAAAQGYLPAVTEVGIAFLYGIGVKRDFQKAYRYLERAAEAGLPKAQYTLGRAYESGIGVTKNRIMALKWYILAAERQHAAATSRIEDISHKTKKEERDKATELAREHNQRYRDTDRSGTGN